MSLYDPREKREFFSIKMDFPSIFNSFVHLVEVEIGEEEKALNIGELILRKSIIKIWICNFQVGFQTQLVKLCGLHF
jgi:hypothetical protein